MRRKITVYDTTLRDGAQTEGISFSVQDKIRIAQKLDELSIDFIEGGWPGSNPKDFDFFKLIPKIKLKHAKIVAFGSTRRPHRKAGYDPNLRSLVKAGTRYVTIFGKSWDLHVHKVLHTSLDENLSMIYDSITYLKGKGLKVFFDAEHFFDGYRANRNYALKTLKVAQDAGADFIVLCDTNGGMITSWIREIVREVKQVINCELGIHTHNDSDMAVANSLVAIEEGCSHVQGTINGYGERCGNADLCVLIPNIVLKLGYSCNVEKNLNKITDISIFVAEVSNLKQRDNQPYVGRTAFAHKGGVHINAIMKDPTTYEHVPPEAVGNKRRLLVSELSGKTSIVIKARDLGIELHKEKPLTKKIHKLLQELEHRGFHFEAAEESFELLMHKELGKFKKFFEMEGFRVIVEKTKDGRLISEATVKLKVKGKFEHTVSEGDGPVNALDNALRKALYNFYPVLAEMRLSDFKVRVLDERAGTAARVRVLIQSQDQHETWNTIGVSENIIEASWQALIDSVEYKLLKEKERGKL